MLTDFLVGAFLGFLGSILGAAPTWSFDPSGAAVTVVEFARLVDHWLPLDHLATCFTVLLLCATICGAWKFVVWIYHQFWGSD